jgi:ABC-type lipoprotein export system ATPase subunit
MKIKKISVEKLWNKYTFSIDFDKQVTILIGKNGSGKSTILNLINELLSNGRNDNNYKFKKIELSSFNKNRKISIEQKSLQLGSEIERLNSINKESIEELKKLFDRIQKEIINLPSHTNKEISSSKTSKVILSRDEVDYLFLSTFDMEVKNKELVKKHYDGKSYIKTELDIILNDLITNFKLYLLKIKEQVEKIQKIFDKELEAYANKNNMEGLTKKLLEKKVKIDKIYENRDLFKSKINELFRDTEKKITLDENNSLVFELNDKSYLTPYQLSSGEKQILIIMLNIMLLENKETILLMDEPEISLHVEWQKVFITTLLELNPNLQIIIATHSPAIVSEKFRSKIVRLSNFYVKG